MVTITIYEVQQLMAQYGIIIIAFLVFMEYLSIPGYPGGFILPLVGVMARFEAFTFVSGFLVSLSAAAAAFTAIYALSRIFNTSISKFFQSKKKLNQYFIKTNSWLDKYGNKGILLTRMTPLVRTFVSIPAGVLKMDFGIYFLYSALGTAVYIVGNMLLGYFVTALFV